MDCKMLFNVNKILVADCFVEEYIRFSNGLYDIISKIEKYIDNQYDDTFNGFINRDKVLDFRKYKRIYCSH